MARPKKHIDKKQFESLCALQCTLVEIADFFDCSEDHIENWCKRTYKKRFSDIYQQKRAPGKVSLRRRQYEVAMKGNVSMLIWLGKQWLNQRENLLPEDGDLQEFSLVYVPKSKRLDSDV